MRFPVVLGWGLCGELGTHISSLQFSKFDVRGDVPGRPAVCGLASRSPESARRAARADISRDAQMRRRRLVCSIPTVPVSRAATTKDIIFPLRLNKDAIVIVSVRASRV